MKKFVVKFAKILLCILAVPIVLPILIIVLVVPIRYKINVSTGQSGGTEALVRVTYLFGLIGVIYDYSGGLGTTLFRIAWVKFGSKKKPERKKKTAKTKRKKKIKNKETPKTSLKEKYTKIKSNASGVLTYPNLRIIIGHVLHTLKKLWNTTKPRRLNVSGTIGFEDPSTTGLFFAAYGVVRQILGLGQNVDISCNFNTPCTIVQLKIYVKGRVCIGRVVWLILMLAIKKEIRALIGDLLI